MNLKQFVNDECVIGKWEYYATLNSNEKFNPNKKYYDCGNEDFKEIYFLPNGQKYWIFEGWTKGLLYIHYGGDEPILCYKYAIETFNNKYFMFLEITAENEAHIEVLIKTSSKPYKLNEIGRRDNIDIPFVLDEAVIGEWKSVGFVNNIEDFTNEKPDEYWLKSITFFSDGKLQRKYSDEIWEDKWTKGFLIDEKKSVLSSYIIKKINGKEYLFMEWKMGNYVYGGYPPNYYVLIRKI